MEELSRVERSASSSIEYKTHYYLSSSCSSTTWQGVTTSLPFLINSLALVCKRSYDPMSVETRGILERMSRAVMEINSSLYG